MAKDLPVLARPEDLEGCPYFDDVPLHDLPSTHSTARELEVYPFHMIRSDVQNKSGPVDLTSSTVPGLDE